MEKAALALFDFDGTLIKGDTIVRYVLFALKHKKMSFWELLRTLHFALWGFCFDVVTDERAKTEALRFWTRMSAGERDKFDKEFAGTLLPKIYKEGLAELNAQKAAGKRVLIVSASTENYMKYIAKALAVNALLCTRVSFSGIVTGNCKGKEKLRRIDAWLEKEHIECDAAHTVAYGDTGSDFDMLTHYGDGNMVNPKRALKKKSKGRLPIVFWQ